MVDVRLVQTYATSEYIYCQFTRSFTGTSPPEQDRDLGIPQFLYFARGARYNATSFIVTNQDIFGVSPRKERVVDYVVVPIQYPDLTLIKVHGSFMIFTFLFLIPIGIILSTFYKVVWPNGGWFFVSLLNFIILATPSVMFVQCVLRAYCKYCMYCVYCIYCLYCMHCMYCVYCMHCVYYVYCMY